MIDQSYSEKGLRRYQRRIRTRGMTEVQRDKLISSLSGTSTKVNSGTYKFSNFNHRTINKKIVWKNKSYEEQLILRYTNQILKRILKVKQSNRNKITKNIINLLSSGQNFSILKTDIRDFYESIPFKFITEKIFSESIFSNQVKNMLNELQREAETYSKGLPRGICISATISELYMRKFDSLININDSVFFYSRYVDDIIIFCMHDNMLSINEIRSHLPEGLKLNSKKTLWLHINCRCKFNCSCTGSCKCLKTCKCEDDSPHSFEYLGYKYIFSDLPVKGKKAKEVSIRIGESKVKKIKTRIIQSFLDYFRKRNFLLLKNRIQFLTSNYYVFNNIGSSNLKAGIYYSYPNLSKMNDLEDLDLFLRKTIFCKKGSFGKKIKNSLTRAQKLDLTSFSFAKGYENRIIVNFSGEEINEIKYCWNNG